MLSYSPLTGSFSADRWCIHCCKHIIAAPQHSSQQLEIDLTASTECKCVEREGRAKGRTDGRRKEYGEETEGHTSRGLCVNLWVCVYEWVDISGRWKVECEERCEDSA
jgi:hypothetical protein